MIERFAPMNHCYQQHQLDTFLREVSEIGFKKIDLWTCPTHFYVDNFWHEDVNTLRKKLSEQHLVISCLSPRQSCPNPFHLAVKNTEAIQRTRNYFQQIIYAAHELEVPRIMVTSGWSFQDEAWEVAWGRSVELCRWVCQFAQSYGVKIAIEPLTKSSTKLVNSCDRMFEYFTEVDHKNLKVILDTGTVLRSEDSISKYFKTFGDKIDYCHLTNYQSNQFAHVAWHDGEFELFKVLKELELFGYAGDFCLEYTATKYQKNPKKVYEATYHQIKKMEENK